MREKELGAQAAAAAEKASWRRAEGETYDAREKAPPRKLQPVWWHVLPARWGRAVCSLLRLLQHQEINMRDGTATRAKSQPPQWAIFVIAVIADLLAAGGFVPAQHEAILRSVVMYCLYREWGLAFACGFVLPRSLPLAGVCFLKQKWLALKVSVKPAVTKIKVTLARCEMFRFSQPLVFRKSYSRWLSLDCNDSMG